MSSSFRFDRACKLVEVTSSCFLPHTQPQPVLYPQRATVSTISRNSAAVPTEPIDQPTRLHGIIREPVEQNLYPRPSCRYSFICLRSTVLVLFRIPATIIDNDHAHLISAKQASCNTHRLRSPQRLDKTSVGDIHGLESSL